MSTDTAAWRPTPSQVEYMVRAAHDGAAAHGWDQDPTVLAIYRPGPDDDQDQLRWGHIPIPPRVWRAQGGNPAAVFTTLARGLTRPDAMYSLSTESGWDRWAGVLAVVEVWRCTTDHDVMSAADHAECHRQIVEGGGGRGQARIVIALLYGRHGARPTITASTWDDGAPEPAWDARGEPLKDSDGTLVGALDTLGAALSSLAHRITAAGIEPTRQTCDHPIAEFADATREH